MRLAVTINGTSHEVAVKPADMVAFERKYALAWDAVQKNPKVEHTFFLAWNASRRAGLTTDEFDVWLDSVDELDPIEEVPLDSSSGSS